MTRDEAIAIATEAWFGSFSPNREPEAVVRVLVALGLLKLDEPKSVEDRVREVMECEYTKPESFLQGLAARGLKLVSK